MEHIRDVRNSSTWNDISKNNRLSLLTTNQKTQLQEIIFVQDVEKGDIVWLKDSPASHAVIVGENCTVEIQGEVAGSSPRTVTRGAFVCDVDSVLSER